MDKIGGGFDPNIGISPVRDGGQEIGCANLPASAKVIPEGEMVRADALLFGQLSDSALMERLGSYLAVEPRFRELLSPDVFFECLESAERSFADSAGSNGQPEEGPLAEAARQLAQILSDKALCDVLRNLIMKA